MVPELKLRKPFSATEKRLLPLCCRSTKRHDVALAQAVFVTFPNRTAPSMMPLVLDVPETERPNLPVPDPVAEPPEIRSGCDVLADGVSDADPVKAGAASGAAPVIWPTL